MCEALSGLGGTFGNHFFTSITDYHLVRYVNFIDEQCVLNPAEEPVGISNLIMLLYIVCLGFECENCTPWVVRI